MERPLIETIAGWLMFIVAPVALATWSLISAELEARRRRRRRERRS